MDTHHDEVVWHKSMLEKDGLGVTLSDFIWMDITWTLEAQETLKISLTKLHEPSVSLTEPH